MILSFEKPEKILSTEEWKKISADGAPPGVYVSNMSEEDRMHWKAKIVGHKTKNFVIEIRSEKTGSNLLVVVHGAMPTKVVVDESVPIWSRPKLMVPYELRISTNGQLTFSPPVWQELFLAVEEARKVLFLLDNETARSNTLKRIKEGQSPLETP